MIKSNLLKFIWDVDTLVPISQLILQGSYTINHTGRLMEALAESDDVTMPYVNRTIQRLEKERQALLQAQANEHTRPYLPARRIQFSKLDFEQKKLVVGQSIQAICLTGDKTEVAWNV